MNARVRVLLHSSTRMIIDFTKLILKKKKNEWLVKTCFAIQFCEPRHSETQKLTFF